MTAFPLTTGQHCLSSSVLLVLLWAVTVAAWPFISRRGLQGTHGVSHLNFALPKTWCCKVFSFVQSLPHLFRSPFDMPYRVADPHKAALLAPRRRQLALSSSSSCRAIFDAFDGVVHGFMGKDVRNKKFA